MALHWRVLPHSDPHCLRPARRQALPPHTVTPHGSRAGRGSAARAFRRTVGGQVVAAAPWTAKPMRDIIQRRKSGTPHGGLERRCNRPVDRRKGSLVTDQRVASPATEGGRSCAAPDHLEVGRLQQAASPVAVSAARGPQCGADLEAN